MLVPNSQACDNQMSSVKPVPADVVARRVAFKQSVEDAAGRARVASDAIRIANPWENWRGGFNLMKDTQRGNLYNGAPNTGTLPGLSNDQQVLLMQILGRNPRAGNARQTAAGWDSRFITASNPPACANSRGMGAAPQNCASLACGVPTLDSAPAADVVPSDGILTYDAPPLQVPTPPANPSLRTDQPGNVIVRPPVHGSSTARTLPMRCMTASGMAEWSPSLEQPGAVPADCMEVTAGAGSDTTDELPATRGDGASGPPKGAGIPWWLWALGGVVLLSVVSDERETRRSSGKKRPV